MDQTLTNSRNRLVLQVSVLCLLGMAVTAQAQNPKGDPTLTEQWEPIPHIVTPGSGNGRPSDAIMLFDGDDLAQWQNKDGSQAGWDVSDGVMTVASGTEDIYSRQVFGDVQLHIEWRTPGLVEGDDQGRGNSGVFLQGLYEVQVLDSFQNNTYSNGQAASIYKQHIPLVNASRGPGEWQVYDIVFNAPRFSSDAVLEKPAFITVFHNGVLVQNHVEIKGATVYIGQPQYQAHAPKLALMLQNHNNPVSYRNIWVRDL